MAIPTAKLETKFPIRNDRRFLVREGINYTTNTLHQILSAAIADDLAIELQFRMNQLGYPQYLIYSYTPDVAGSTLAFLDNKNVTGVTAYTINKEYADLLSNNIRMYGFTLRATVISAEFSGIPSDKRGAIMFLDPIWGARKTPNINIPELIKENKYCTYVIVKTPVELRVLPRELTTDTDWEVSTFQIKKHLFYFLKSKIIASRYARFPRVQDVPAPRRLPTSLQDPALREYKESLKLFISRLITPVLYDKPPVEGQRDHWKYLGDEQMNLWIRAFCDNSFDPKYNFNTIETVGDKLLKSLFADYVIRNFSNLNQKIITLLEIQYMSMRKQAQYARDLNFDKFILVGDKMRLEASILEDVTEAFIGTLFVIAERYDERYKGFAVCNKMLEFILKDYKIDPKAATSDAKSRVKEIFENAFGIQMHGTLQDKYIREKIRPSGYKTYIELEIGPFIVNYLKARGYGGGQILASASGADKSEARLLLYQDVLDLLIKYGFTTEEIKKQRRIREFEKPIYADLRKQFEEKLARDKMFNADFVFVREVRENKFYNLVANPFSDPNVTKILGSGVARTSREAKLAAFRDYVLNKP